ncbi:hypothetical protein D9M70_627080 [compost metagenome]
MSAACARCRACTTKQSSQNGHSLPRQLSMVEVTSGSNGESSGSAASSAMSPNFVRPPHATMRWNWSTCSRLVKVVRKACGSPLAWLRR